jgi:hypothetical protein
MVLACGRCLEIQGFSGSTKNQSLRGQIVNLILDYSHLLGNPELTREKGERRCPVLQCSFLTKTS